MVDTLIIRDDVGRGRAMDIIQCLNLSRPYEITIKQYRKKRSLSQNALMWKWLNVAADLLGSDLGYDAEEMHHIFKNKFLPASGRTLLEIDGEQYEKLTTTNLNTGEMFEYMEAIYRFCASFGCILPHPQDIQRNL